RSLCRLTHRRAAVPGLGGHGGGDCALDERRLSDQDPLICEHLLHTRGGENGRAQIAQQHHLTGTTVQRAPHALGNQVITGAEATLIGPTGGQDQHIRGHLPCYLGTPFCEQHRVRDQNQGCRCHQPSLPVALCPVPESVVPEPAVPEPACSRAASSPACSSSALDWAPGSRWPRDRSP